FAAAFALGILDTRLAMKAEGFQSGLEPAQRVVLAASALWFYIWKIFIPHPLVHIYAKWDMLEPAWWRWLLIPAGAVLLAVLFAWRERIGRGPLAAALFFCVSLGPVLGLVDFTYMEHSWVADRFVYLAS